MDSYCPCYTLEHPMDKRYGWKIGAKLMSMTNGTSNSERVRRNGMTWLGQAETNVQQTLGPEKTKRRPAAPNFSTWTGFTPYFSKHHWICLSISSCPSAKGNRHSYHITPISLIISESAYHSRNSYFQINRNKGRSEWAVLPASPPMQSGFFLSSPKYGLDKICISDK